MTHIRFDNAQGSVTLVLAHGAGAPMDSDFMEAITSGLVDGYDVRVARFEFPYMAARREDGKKRGPNGTKVLLDTWRAVYAEMGPCFIGGKSMGGRMASMVADELGALGLVCLGYPFHPPGKPEKLRTEHLAELRTPTLILQGTRDPFGNADEVTDYDLSEHIEVAWLTDGDHSFKPRKSSGLTQRDLLTRAVDHIGDFMGLT